MTTTETPRRPADSAAGLHRKSLLDLESLTAGEIVAVLDAAAAMRGVMNRSIKKVPALRGRSVVTLFYENSTRTRSSFELAGKVMSADVVNISAASSSVQKGESLKDTALTLEAMGMDLVVIRHPMAGAPHFVARQIDIPVINAGDGLHEHPTQGLLDLFTLREACGRLADLKVLIAGDIRHSRVARSDIWGLRHLGAEVRLCGPAPLMPPGIEASGAKVFEDMDEAVEGVDAIITLRIQLERQSSAFFPSLREYSERFGINRERASRAADEVVVLHPGPMNRGLEISADIADAGCSLITNQVTNGVAVRMALLHMLLEGGRPPVVGE